MSNLIVEIDNEFILLADGTRIEINMSYDEYGNGNPCGFIIHEAVEQSDCSDEVTADREISLPCPRCGKYSKVALRVSLRK